MWQIELLTVDRPSPSCPTGEQWHPVLERKRRNAAPELYPSREDAEDAMTALRLIQPTVTLRAVPVAFVAPSTDVVLPLRTS